jgi:glycosyltransferase involved in cell wall biosynthesis
MTADSVGGVWTYALDLAEGLSKRGLATTLAVMGPEPTSHQVVAARRVPDLELIATALPLDWMAVEPAEIEEVGAALRGLSRACKADLIHLNSPAYAAGARFEVPVLGACHSCLATWWSAVKDGPMPPDFAWRSQVLWRGMMACDALVAPSRAFAQATALTYDTPAPFVVHNGRQPPPFTWSLKREPVVFTSGRLWDEAKNLVVLDRAAALARVTLIAAGELESPSRSNRVHLSHARPVGQLRPLEVTARLRRASIFASAALYEPFGLGVLEAAQCGCALVLSDIATFRELWDGAALFAPPNDAEAFAELFNELLADPGRAADMAAKARVRAKRFTVERMTEGILDLYARTVEVAAAGGRKSAAA